MSEAEATKSIGAQHLYRHYDKDGALLYVGVSTSALRRLTEHEAVSHWFDEITSVKIEHFQSRAEALEAERRAIREENPRHNLMRPGIEREKKSRPDDSRADLLRRVANFGFIYTVKDAAAQFGIGLTAMKRIIDSGAIGTVVVQGKLRITGWQMIDYIEHLEGQMGGHK